MFKLKAIPRFIPTNVRAVKGDIIRCNLPDSDNMDFYVLDVTPYGVILGGYVEDVGLYPWLFGENYDIICSTFSM